MIATDAWSAYMYAREILMSPWPKAEPVIAQDPVYARRYKDDVLKTLEDRARFKEVQKWHAPN